MATPRYANFAIFDGAVRLARVFHLFHKVYCLRDDCSAGESMIVC
jgi:hypothetical protein